MFRQGDVLLIEVNEIPNDATPVKRESGKIILAYGEVTGHHHAIAAPQVKMLQLQDNRYLDSATSFSITHEEHATVKVPAGKFQVIIQREYSPQEIRNVLD